jgi:hypothetical protein
MTWSLAITGQHVKIPYHNHSNFLSSPQQIIVVMSSSTKSIISPKLHSTSSTPSSQPQKISFDLRDITDATTNRGR